MKLQALDPLLYSREDQLYKDFVDHFYSLITTSIEPPYAISLDGLWGTGKTTVMQKIQNKLEDAAYPVFWFNPWEYRQSDNVVAAFLRKLANANRSLLDEMQKQSGLTILSVLAETAMGVGLSTFTGGKISLKDIHGVFKSVEDNQKLSFTKYDDLIETVKKEFIGLIDRVSEQHEGKPVIIFFDDLDRCLPDDTVKLLEALKNLFVAKRDDNNTKCKAIFVCGIDTHIAKEFIQEHYKGIEENFAINYFRKIFNLTISMPRSPDLKKLLIQYIHELYEWEIDDKKNESLANIVVTRGLQAHISSVRTYLNVVTTFYTFLRFNPDYEMKIENDFVLTLLIMKEAWSTVI
ncbi:KAP NTPase domain-containing protein [Candidatus Electrothrix aarhusensis]